MKKIFSNLWFMVTSLAFAVIMLIACICLIVRPISYNMVYSHIEDDTISTIIFIDKTTAVFEEKVDGVISIEGEDKYYEKDGRLAVYHSDITMPFEDFKTFCQEKPANEWEEMSYEITAFYFDFDGMIMKCSDAVTLVIILGAVDLLLIANATLSTIFYIKNRKKKSLAV